MLLDDSCPTGLLYKTDDLPAYPENAQKRDQAAPTTGCDQSGMRRTDGGGSGSSASERTTWSSLDGVDDLAAGHAGQLLEHLGPGRAAGPLGRGALDEERRLQLGAGLLAEERHLVAARLLGAVTGR